MEPNSTKERYWPVNILAFQRDLSHGLFRNESTQRMILTDTHYEGFPAVELPICIGMT